MEKINKVSNKLSNKAAIAVFCAVSMTACVTSGQDKVQTLPNQSQFPAMAKTSAVVPSESATPASGAMTGAMTGAGAESPKELQQPLSHNPQLSFWLDLVKTVIVGCIASGTCW